MRKRNWPQYNKHLVEVGSISFFIDPKFLGRGRPRKWVKVHIAVDAETQEIVAECTTESSVADSTVAKRLLGRVIN